MNIYQEVQYEVAKQNTRRQFLKDCASGLGALWLGSSLSSSVHGASAGYSIHHDPNNPLNPLPPAFAPKVKNIIFLHMVGGPSQLELFDYKPELSKVDGQDCPKEFLEGQNFAFIQGTPKMMGSLAQFSQHGQSGAWVSEYLPHFSKIVDEVCFIKTMKSDQFNHGPAQLLVHTGTTQSGNASMGSWVTYGLGSENQNLPGFMVLVSGGRLPRGGKKLWSSGYLPSVYQGVLCRSSGDPILNVSNPAQVPDRFRKAALERLNNINELTYQSFQDPEINTRIAQYEMAHRMQTSVPEAMDISDEPDKIHELYGSKPGGSSFANNCLLARKLVEKGVRFVQLYDYGWDSHGSQAGEALNVGFLNKCEQMDRPMSALIMDLKQRGMLEDTLVVWGTEFGRTPMRENRNGRDMKYFGRDHNPGSFTYWMAGAGVKKGFTYGETDAMGYQVAKDPVWIRDFHATLLHMLGFDHKQLTYPYQGLNQKLSGVKEANVIRELFA
ncbi:MAG: DUF1501 domain-containing protein [Coraliomargaritaceae bacterium]